MPKSLNLLSVALFLIGIILLVESAATVFVIIETNLGALTVIMWVYILLKTLISLFVLIVGYTSRVLK